MEAMDSRADYGEVRVKAVGAVGSDVLTVIDTVRGSVVRIISARQASRKERSRWLRRA